MITVAQLLALVTQLPDDAQLTAYEGEGIGLRIESAGRYGWIETGPPGKPADPSQHDLGDVASPNMPPTPKPRDGAR